MNRSNESDPSGSTGFEYSRRVVLKTGAALCAGAAVAGCQSDSDESSPTSADTQSGETLVADGLNVRESELVSSEDGLGNFLRVVVENELDETVSFVGLTAQFFDDDVEFLEVQTATIYALAPGEAFEGHVRHFVEDPGAYVIHADRSKRDGTPVSLDDVDATHCLDHRQVRGTVSNGQSEAVPRLRVRATFYNEEGDILGSGTDTITELDAGEETSFAVDFDRDVNNDSVNVDDYEVTVGDYSDTLLSVR